MKFFAEIHIMPHPELLEPQGQAAARGLSSLDLGGIEKVRIGKHVEMTFEAPSEAEANQLVNTACEKLLANSLTETFSFSIETVVEENAK